jgi:O-antigen/teichoic acid export membrane protein
MSQLRSIGNQTVVYTAGTIIGKIASFVMLPIYTRFLTPADYGILELLGMTIDVIGMIAGIGLVAGVFKFYSAEDDAATKRSVMSTAEIGVMVLATVTSLIGLAVAPFLSHLLFGAHANVLYVRLFFLLYFLQNFEQIPLLLLRAENRAVLFVTLNVLKLIMQLSLNILFVVHLRMGIEGVLLSSIITGIVVAIGLTAYLVRRVGIGFRMHNFREMLAFGSPLVLWSLGSFVLVFSDRFFLNHYIDTASVGIYSLAYKFAFVLSALAATPFQTVWDVQRFEVAKRPDGAEIFGRVFLYMNVIVGSVGLAIIVFVHDFLLTMSDPSFLSAYRLVPLLIAAQIVFIWAAYWNFGIFMSGDTKWMARGTFVLVPLTLGLNFALIPRYGVFGAAWATFVAYAARFFWLYYFSQRQYPIHYRWFEMARLYGVLGAAATLSFIYRPPGLIASLGWNVVLLCAALGIVYLFILSRDDRSSLRLVAQGYLSALKQRRTASVAG